ncbi:putative carnitine deficiency-associated protein [Ditylenchus destructor]|nr:putative carnitine deficiency-associated protein [Ditylenchus destructor]
MSEVEVASQIQNLASLLGITAHSDPKVTAMAIDKYLKRISLGELNAKQQEEIKTFPLQTFDLGVHATGNNKIDDAIRALRLLHVARQRELQSQINDTLARVQKVTADPKADLKLGKIGR